MDVVAHRDHPREQWREGVESRMWVSARTGAAQLCVFEQWLAPGAGPPTHRHRCEEVLTVLAGRAEVWIDDRRAVLDDGQSLVIPAGRRHGFRNVGAATLHVQAVLASAVFEATFDDADAPVLRWLPPSPRSD